MTKRKIAHKKPATKQPAKPTPAPEAVTTQSAQNVLDWAYIGRYGLTRDDVDCELNRDGNGAYECASEVASLAESMMDALGDVADSEAEAHQRAAHLEACASRLCAISARIMLHAGRLEGVHISLNRAEKGVRQLRAHKAGRLPAFSDWPAVDTSEVSE